MGMMFCLQNKTQLNTEDKMQIHLLVGKTHLGTGYRMLIEHYWMFLLDRHCRSTCHLSNTQLDNLDMLLLCQMADRYRTDNKHSWSIDYGLGRMCLQYTKS
jgi:hypothetical protein